MCEMISVSLQVKPNHGGQDLLSLWYVCWVPSTHCCIQSRQEPVLPHEETETRRHLLQGTQIKCGRASVCLSAKPGSAYCAMLAWLTEGALKKQKQQQQKKHRPIILQQNRGGAPQSEYNMRHSTQLSNNGKAAQEGTELLWEEGTSPCRIQPDVLFEVNLITLPPGLILCHGFPLYLGYNSEFSPWPVRLGTISPVCLYILIPTLVCRAMHVHLFLVKPHIHPRNFTRSHLPFIDTSTLPSSLDLRWLWPSEKSP